MVLYDAPLWIVLAYLFALGSVVGSFLNVCIYRFPLRDRLRDQLTGLLSPPSTCPRCGNRIRAIDNIPIFGWLKLGGRCRYCKGRIAPRYPLIELANALLFVLVYWMEIPSQYGATMGDSCVYTSLGPHAVAGSTWLSATAVVHWRYLYHMVLFESLLVATFIDFDHMIIPDGATLPAMAVGLVGGGVVGRVFLVPVWFQDPIRLRMLIPMFPDWMRPLLDAPRIPEWIGQYPQLHGLAVSLTGLIVGGGLVWIVRIVGARVLRREAMGFGDVILMAMIGSFLGWQPVVMVFCLAPVCALFVLSFSWILRRQREFPYGPYLSLAALVVVLGWKPLWSSAEPIFGLGLFVPLLGLVMVALLWGCLILIQLAKRLFGIPLYPAEWTDEGWSSADQLLYQQGESIDPHQGVWPTDQWPGTTASRGLSQESRWRHGNDT